MLKEPDAAEEGFGLAGSGLGATGVDEAGGGGGGELVDEAGSGAGVFEDEDEAGSAAGTFEEDAVVALFTASLGALAADSAAGAKSLECKVRVPFLMPSSISSLEMIWPSSS